MMKWRKSPEALVDAFQSALPEDARVERRKMFGYPCAFVNGNMFTGLHQEIDSAKELKGWLRRSLEHSATLPPNGAKRAASRVAKKPAAAKAGTARKRVTSSPAKKKATASRTRSAR